MGIRTKFSLPRYHGPFVQNIISGIVLGFTGGIYSSLNSMGAAGGRPDSAQVIQTMNATLCAVWFFSSCFAGSVLNKLGPAITMFLGALGYIVYVGSLWYFDEVGKEVFPVFAAVIIGIGAGFDFGVAGWIQLTYPEESEKGTYIATQLNLQALGTVIGAIIPLIIDHDTSTSKGVPRQVYIALIIVMCAAALSALLLLPPDKLKRADGSVVAVYPARSVLEELKSTLLIFTDWKLLLCFPAFLPGEFFLVWNGSLNSYHNNLRTRSLLSFMGVTLQIPFGIILQKLLDNPHWGRRKRALVGLAYVAVPLWAAWIWELVRVRDYDRHVRPPGMDWTDPNFAPIFVLFVVNWISGSLWIYVVTYFLGALTNEPVKASHYAGVFRGILGAGEAVCFGLDSLGTIPYIKEAGFIFAVYAAGTLVFVYLACFQIDDTMYFKEEGVVVPTHVVEERSTGGGGFVESKVVESKEKF